jgi:hypothetical protein
MVMLLNEIYSSQSIIFLTVLYAKCYKERACKNYQQTLSVISIRNTRDNPFFIFIYEIQTFTPLDDLFTFTRALSVCVRVRVCVCGVHCSVYVFYFKREPIVLPHKLVPTSFAEPRCVVL